MPPERAAGLFATIERWAEEVRFLLPSTESGKPAVRAASLLARAGRLIVDWMIADGLAAYGRADLADRLRQDALELVARGGSWEYFDSYRRRGGDFTWTAAATLFWSL